MQNSQNARALAEDAKIAHDLANLHARLGEYQTAERLVREAITVLERDPSDRDKLVVCVGMLGWLLASQGDYASARAEYQRASKLAKDISDRENALALDDLASLEVQFAEAEPLYEKALALYRTPRAA